MKKLILIFIFLLCGGRAWGQWKPVDFNTEQDTNYHTQDSIHLRTVIGAPPYFYQTDTSWEDIDNSFVNSGDTLLQALKSVLKTKVTTDGRSKVTITWKGNEYTVTQRLLGIGWMNVETLARHWIDSTMNWSNISYDSNIVTWRNVSPQIDFQVRKTNGQVAHGIFYKPLFLDSAVTLYNQRADSADLALGNVMIYTLSANIENPDSIGRMSKRKLKKLGEWTFELGRQRVFFPGSDTIHVPVFQEWVQIGGKYVCIEYVMGSHVKQIHEAYPEAVIWHNATTQITGADDTEDAYIDGSEGDEDTNYGSNVALHWSPLVSWRTWIGFNLSGVSGTINASICSIYVNYSGGAESGVRYIKARRVLKNATEVGITWNKYDGSTDWDTAGGGIGNDMIVEAQDSITCPNWTTCPDGWNVFDWNDENGGSADMTQDWIDGTYPNYGVMIIGAPSSDVEARSSDYADADYHPRLYVDYTAGVAAGQVIIIH